jgi:hypothetical protein
MCQYIKRPKRKRKRKGNRTDKRKKERTKYFEYYSTPSDKYIYIYILYVIMTSIEACAIPFFSLYMPLAGCFCRSIVASCGTRATGKKRQKKEKLRDAMHLSNMEREKGGERFFFSSCVSIEEEEKKRRARERGCRGREREKEAATRRVH